ncbi:MAG: FAD-binding oxidoreductase [Acidimicrobiia bacterium]
MVSTLTDRFRGVIHRPGSAGYDEARSIWNGQVDRRPALIATCAGPDDVTAAVRHAIDGGLPLSVRAGGHHVAGSAIVDWGIVIDLSTMNGVRLDPATGRVRAQGGAKLGDLDRNTLPYGRVVPAGIDQDTGVGGLTLGGGVGWSMRRLGLACDSLGAAQLVMADGNQARVDDETDPDLMWALRGGGGNFGIVTEFEFDSAPIPRNVLAGFVVYHGADAADVLRGYRDIVDTAPDELTTIVFLRVAPPVPWVPAELVGEPIVMVGVVFQGEADVGAEVVAPLRSLGRPAVDTVALKPFLEHQEVLEGANPIGHRYYWKSAHVDGLSDTLIDLMARHLDSISSPLSLLGFFQLGGRVTAAEDRSCFPNRDAAFLVNYAVHWIDPGEDEAHRTWTRTAMSELEPQGRGAGYVNFLAEDEGAAVEAVYGPERLDRLAAIKRRVDPGNLFRHNQNIRPDAGS